MTAINLDHLDTNVPAEGAEFEFRGQVFRLRRWKIEEQFDDELVNSVKYKQWENIEELQDMFRIRMFRTKSEFDKFWKTVTTKYKDPAVDGVRAPMQLHELMPLAAAMLEISNGTYDEEKQGEDPKDEES